MNPREQKLLGLILIVLAYVACDYLYRAASGFENEGLTAQSAEASAAVTAMAGQLNSLPLSENGRHLLKLANSPMESDPFEAPSAGMRASVTSGMPQLTLSGVLSMGSTNIALIGGEEYGIGDVVPDTNETVKAIGLDSVTLAAQDGTTRTLKVLDLEPNLTDLTNTPAQPALK